MRIDLYRGGTRPWYISLGLRLIKLRVGMMPAPPVVMTYRPDLVEKRLKDYFMATLSGAGGWSKGHTEMFAAFVSKLNACRF